MNNQISFSIKACRCKEKSMCVILSDTYSCMCPGNSIKRLRKFFYT